MKSQNQSVDLTCSTSATFFFFCTWQKKGTLTTVSFFFFAVSAPTEKLSLSRSFTAYMDEHKNLRTICEEGKGKLQWERDIPPKDLENLENLANSDFHANLGKIIHDIYLTGHNLFRDMPQGDHKKRAKYRFASKTLMRILPDKMKSEVEALINQKAMTLDLYEILGQCTWGKKEEGKSL